MKADLSRVRGDLTFDMPSSHFYHVNTVLAKLLTVLLSVKFRQCITRVANYSITTILLIFVLVLRFLILEHLCFYLIRVQELVVCSCMI
jgi:hypothetical protein